MERNIEPAVAENAVHFSGGTKWCSFDLFPPDPRVKNASIAYLKAADGDIRFFVLHQALLASVSPLLRELFAAVCPCVKPTIIVEGCSTHGLQRFASLLYNADLPDFLSKLNSVELRELLFIIGQLGIDAKLLNLQRTSSLPAAGIGDGSNAEAGDVSIAVTGAGDGSKAVNGDGNEPMAGTGYGSKAVAGAGDGSMAVAGPGDGTTAVNGDGLAAVGDAAAEESPVVAVIGNGFDAADSYAGDGFDRAGAEANYFAIEEGATTAVQEITAYHHGFLIMSEDSAANGELPAEEKVSSLAVEHGESGNHTAVSNYLASQDLVAEQNDVNYLFDQDSAIAEQNVAPGSEDSPAEKQVFLLALQPGEPGNETGEEVSYVLVEFVVDDCCDVLPSENQPFAAEQRAPENHTDECHSSDGFPSENHPSVAEKSTPKNHTDECHSSDGFPSENHPFVAEQRAPDNHTDECRSLLEEIVSDSSSNELPSENYPISAEQSTQENHTDECSGNHTAADCSDESSTNNMDKEPENHTDESPILQTPVAGDAATLEIINATEDGIEMVDLTGSSNAHERETSKEDIEMVDVTGLSNAHGRETPNEQESDAGGSVENNIKEDSDAENDSDLRNESCSHKGDNDMHPGEKPIRDSENNCAEVIEMLFPLPVEDGSSAAEGQNQPEKHTGEGLETGKGENPETDSESTDESSDDRTVKHSEANAGDSSGSHTDENSETHTDGSSESHTVEAKAEHSEFHTDSENLTVENSVNHMAGRWIPLTPVEEFANAESVKLLNPIKWMNGPIKFSQAKAKSPNAGEYKATVKSMDWSDNSDETPSAKLIGKSDSSDETFTAKVISDDSGDSSDENPSTQAKSDSSYVSDDTQPAKSMDAISAENPSAKTEFLEALGIFAQNQSPKAKSPDSNDIFNNNLSSISAEFIKVVKIHGKNCQNCVCLSCNKRFMWEGGLMNHMENHKHIESERELADTIDGNVGAECLTDEIDGNGAVRLIDGVDGYGEAERADAIDGNVRAQELADEVMNVVDTAEGVADGIDENDGVEEFGSPAKKRRLDVFVDISDCNATVAHVSVPVNEQATVAVEAVEFSSDDDVALSMEAVTAAAMEAVEAAFKGEAKAIDHENGIVSADATATAATLSNTNAEGSGKGAQRYEIDKGAQGGKGIDAAHTSSLFSNKISKLGKENIAPAKCSAVETIVVASTAAAIGARNVAGCAVCWSSFPSAAERDTHLREAHRGTRNAAEINDRTVAAPADAPTVAEEAEDAVMEIVAEVEVVTEAVASEARCLRCKRNYSSVATLKAHLRKFHLMPRNAAATAVNATAAAAAMKATAAVVAVKATTAAGRHFIICVHCAKHFASDADRDAHVRKAHRLQPQKLRRRPNYGLRSSRRK